MIPLAVTRRQERYASDGHTLPREGNVGQIPACDSFAEYARLAAARLGLQYDDAEVRSHEINADSKR